MAKAFWTGLRRFTTTALASAVLGACGGGNQPVSELLSGTAANGAPLVGATVQLRCADGRELNTSTNESGMWQVVLIAQALPCALQASGGSLNDLPNDTTYHTVILSYGVNNVTPLTNLVVARMLGSNPQTWFAQPDFSRVNLVRLQTALANVLTGLGLRATLGQSNPFTEPFAAISYLYLLDRVLVAMDATLSDPLVNKSYAQLLDAAVTGNLETAFAAYGAAFARAYASLPSN
jgi:hypothetical protein